MPKKMRFGEKPPSEKDQILAIADRLRKEARKAIPPAIVARACIDENVFTKEQLAAFSFETVLRRVEACMKTPDESGLARWGQIPLRNDDGALLWDKRSQMKLRGYAWNYILRDDVVQENTITRERWKTEALLRWTEAEFDAEVLKLRAERNIEEAGDAA